LRVDLELVGIINYDSDFMCNFFSYDNSLFINKLSIFETNFWLCFIFLLGFTRKAFGD
jgi:hypothetical protein